MILRTGCLEPKKFGLLKEQSSLDSVGFINSAVSSVSAVSAVNDPVLSPFGNGEKSSICPLPNNAPSKTIFIQEDQGNPLEDADKDLKDLATDMVVNKFFTTKDSLLRFMKVVYENIDTALSDYRSSIGVDERAIFLLFKGGNVLRMVANELFELVSPEAKEFCKKSMPSTLNDLTLTLAYTLTTLD